MNDIDKHIAECERLATFAKAEVLDSEEMKRVESYLRALPALLRDLDRLARLGNKPHYGNSDGNKIAQQALAALSREAGLSERLPEIDK